MAQKKLLEASQLAVLAKESRAKAGMTKAKVAKLLGVTRGTVHQAEEYPEMSLTRLRIRIIQLCAGGEVSGPLYRVDYRGGKRAEK